MTENIPPGEIPLTRETPPPFKHDDISDTRELQGYDWREKARGKNIQRSESPNFFHIPRRCQTFDQFCRFATQYVVGLQTTDPLSPGSLADIYALDVVFVAIDFEGNLPIKPPSEIGIATLDTRDLRSALTSPISPPKDLIKSEHFCMRSPWHHSKLYCSFLFGETECMAFGGAKTKLSVLMDSLFIRDKQLNPPAPNHFRNIVLVGQDFYAELDCMSSLGLRAEAFSHVVCILDTARLGREFVDSGEMIYPRHGKMKYISLRDLLDNLQCPYSNLHNAGNDANFTIRALLLMVAQKAELNSVERTRVAKLEEIARAPLPGKRLPPKPTVTDRKSKARRNRKPLGERGISVDWTEALSDLKLDEQ